MAPSTRLRSHSSMLLAVVATALLLSSSSASMVDVDCDVDIQGLMGKCGTFVMKDGPKIPPSADCCELVRKTDIPCACKLLEKAPGTISMDKVCYVAGKCGKPLVPGTKCGNFVIPPVC